MTSVLAPVYYSERNEREVVEISSEADDKEDVTSHTTQGVG